MISDELQLKIHKGDEAAFKTLYTSSAKAVYGEALNRLHNEEKAKAVVKTTFVALRKELMQSSGPLDVDARIQALMENALKDAAKEVPSRDDGKEKPKNPSAPQGTRREDGAAHADAVDGLPPLERTRAYMNSDPDYPRKGPAQPQRAAGRNLGTALLKCFIILFLILFIWVLIGILMDLKVLPYVDLGFRWFNRNVFALFNA